MASQRVQRQVERLLTEAEEAVARLDWTRARARAQAALALDPGNRDAAAYVAAAERALRRQRGRGAGGPGGAALPTVPFIERNTALVLTWVVLFALTVRVVGLWHPPTMYFDEVYHAFTAREISRGNPAAWEWWNPAPQGYAYEWLHPPLAKLLMAGGILLSGGPSTELRAGPSTELRAGAESFGWRLPGALLGAGAVLLVYLLGRELLNNKSAGVLAAAAFALDGLALVMSRIAMNDIYLVFSALGAILFFLKDRYLLSALFLGLAAATKWSAAWVALVLVAVVLLFRKRLHWGMAWLLVLPPAMYLAAYAPFFLTGHTVAQFIELHRQIWWYQTHLEATHPYQSSWWTWPLLLRPLWMYTASVGDQVANIYALGNPLVFWGGLAAVIAAARAGFSEKQPALQFVAVGWALLFAPWAFSPRIMFIYHYLPAVPFLCLALAWGLLRLWGSERRWLAVGGAAAVAALFVFFYPHWTGIFVPRWWDALYYWLPTWR